MALRQRHGLRIVFRHIDEDELARREVLEPLEQNFGGFRIGGKQRSGLETAPAGPNDADATQHAAMYGPMRGSAAG